MAGNMGQRPGDGKRQGKPKNMKAAMKRLLGYMGGFRRSLMLAVGASVLATVCSLAAPRMMARALDTVQNRLMNQTAIDFRRLGWALALLSALYLLNAAFSLVQGNLMTRVTQEVLCRLRQDTGGKMMRLPLSYFDTHKRGDILSRTTNDIDTIGMALQQAMSQLIPYLITIVGSIVMMAIVSLPLTLLCLLTVPMSMIAARMILKRSQGYIRDAGGGSAERHCGGNLFRDARGQGVRLRGGNAGEIRYGQRAVLPGGDEGAVYFRFDEPDGDDV